MKILYDEVFIAVLFKVLIAATPVAAAIGFLIHRRLGRGVCSRQGRVLWTVLALAGPLNYGLWYMYNAIEDHWGLDRVKPLLINFGIFVVIGVTIGLIVRVLLRGESSQSEPSPTDVDGDESSP